jgi:DNA-binding CsgD family transcriptional regulator
MTRTTIRRWPLRQAALWAVFAVAGGSALAASGWSSAADAHGPVTTIRAATSSATRSVRVDGCSVTTKCTGRATGSTPTIVLTRIEHRMPGVGRPLDSARGRFEELGMREWSRRLSVLQVPELGLPDRLTAREAEILRLVAAQQTNKQNAAELVVSVHTVKRHVQNVYRKIGANSRFDATVYASRVGPRGGSSRRLDISGVCK